MCAAGRVGVDPRVKKGVPEMDGRRFDRVARAFAELRSRRGVFGGMAGLAAGFSVDGALAACPPGRVARPRLGCVCRRTGRPPVGGICPCPRSQTDTGDGQGCLECRAPEDCDGGVCCDNVCRQCCTSDDCEGLLCCSNGCRECCTAEDCPFPDEDSCIGGVCFSCFVAGTRIAMADGSSRPIELVEVGDRVLGRDGRVNRVLGVHRPVLGDRPLYSFNGGPSFVTGSHPFFTSDGWKAVDPDAARRAVPELDIGQLAIGDRLLALAAARVPALAGGGAGAGGVETELVEQQLESLIGHWADPATPLFNLALDGDQTYFADELLVHNKD